jgi:hypothetical protein
VKDESPRPGKVVPFPATDRPEDGVVFRIGRRAFRIDMSVTDITGAPERKVIPIDAPDQETE